jgi:hypothetical protein
MFCKNDGGAGKCFHCNISAVVQAKSNLKPMICRFCSVEPCKRLRGFISSSTFKKDDFFSLQKWWRRREKIHCSNDVSAIARTKSNPETVICKFSSV